MFIIGDFSADIFQYNLTTGYDLSTASYSGTSFNVTAQDNNTQGLTFNSNGTRMFVVGGGVSDSILQYNLTTGYDLSTASYSGNSLSVVSQNNFPQGVFFNSNGTRMFMIGNGDDVFEYNLTTGYDLSTASYSGTSFDVNVQATGPTDVYFNSNGTRMFVSGINTNSVYQYSLTTGFDISTASYDSVSFDVSNEDTSPTGIFFNPTGTKMFMVGNSNDTIYEYNL
jgi:hypothetical protein